MKIALLSCKNWPDVLEKERAFAAEFPKQFDVHVEVWNDPSVKQELAATYSYLLTEVHDKTVYPAEFTVNETIKKYTTGKLGRQEAQKKATQATKDPYSRLTVMMPILEEKITHCINNLKQDF